MAVANWCPSLASRDEGLVFRDIVVSAAFAPGFVLPQTVAATDGEV